MRARAFRIRLEEPGPSCPRAAASSLCARASVLRAVLARLAVFARLRPRLNLSSIEARSPGARGCGGTRERRPGGCVVGDGARCARRSSSPSSTARAAAGSGTTRSWARSGRGAGPSTTAGTWPSRRPRPCPSPSSPTATGRACAAAAAAPAGPEPAGRPRRRKRATRTGISARPFRSACRARRRLNLRPSPAPPRLAFRADSSAGPGILASVSEPTTCASRGAGVVCLRRGGRRVARSDGTVACRCGRRSGAPAPPVRGRSGPSSRGLQISSAYGSGAGSAGRECGARSIEWEGPRYQNRGWLATIPRCHHRTGAGRRWRVAMAACSVSEPQVHQRLPHSTVARLGGGGGGKMPAEKPGALGTFDRACSKVDMQREQPDYLRRILSLHTDPIFGPWRALRGVQRRPGFLPVDSRCGPSRRPADRESQAKPWHCPTAPSGGWATELGVRFGLG